MKYPVSPVPNILFSNDKTKSLLLLESLDQLSNLNLSFAAVLLHLIDIYSS